jgi:hypothetical protein
VLNKFYFTLNILLFCTKIINGWTFPIELFYYNNALKKDYKNILIILFNNNRITLIKMLKNKSIYIYFGVSFHINFVYNNILFVFI